MRSWPRDRFDVAATILQFWWVIASAWIVGTIWLFHSIHSAAH
jgi:hypothetical protein